MKLLQLEKKYPKAFEKFVRNKSYRDYFNRSKNIPVFSLDTRELWKEITDFMDEQGINIVLVIDTYVPTMFYPMVVKWYKGNKQRQHILDEKLLNRKQAESKAIEKAFQILEERSEE